MVTVPTALPYSELRLSSQPTFQHPGDYRSYLVRLWQDNPQAPWRVAVQSVQSGDILHFADLDALFAFLTAQIVSPLPAPHAVAIAKDDAQKNLNRN